MTATIISALQDLENSLGIEVYIAGGFVRDLLRRKSCKDLDIVIRDVSLDKTATFLAKYGKVKALSIHSVNHRKTLDILEFSVKTDPLKAQISCTKNKTGGLATLRQDAKMRDFTINAMYLPINSISAKSVIDTVGGRNDIAEKQILSVGSATVKFKQSPIRILRAFSLSAKTGYRISNHVKHAITDCAHLLKSVPAEAIREELEEILLSAKPSIQLKQMLSLGVLDVILPELAACSGCTQDKRHHKYDVFNHQVYTCDNIESNIVLRLAGLFHDIGKPEVRQEAGTKVTFYKHEVVGSKIAYNILRRLRFDFATIEKVRDLIRFHMYHYTRDYTDAGVRKFIIRVGIMEQDLEDLNKFPLFQLRAAERLGNGLKPRPITLRQLDFQKRIVEVYKSSTGFTVKDLAVSGDSLMQTFGLDPSPLVGDVLRYLLSLVLDEPERNEERVLLHYALDYLLDKIKVVQEPIPSYHQ